MNFNVNDKVRVKLTKNGRAIHRQNYDRIWTPIAPHLILPYTPPAEDAEGWSEWQLWDLMQEFGPSIAMGMKPPFETVIQILGKPPY